VLLARHWHTDPRCGGESSYPILIPTARRKSILTYWFIRQFLIKPVRTDAG